MASALGVILEIRCHSRGEGPGRRSTVYLKGCTLRCVYCDRPESWSLRPEVMFDVAGCDACGDCVSVCGPRRHWVNNGEHVMLPGITCEGCLACVVACDRRAITVLGTVLSVDETIELLARDESDYRAGGGVSISGGEPLLQSEFTVALLRACRARGWHTALCTSGAVPTVVFQQAVEACDLVIMDLKETDPRLHEVWTGGPLGAILRHLRLAAECATELWVRLPVVPLTNDRDDHWRLVAQILAELPGPPIVELVPYQPMSDAKRWGLGLEEGALAGVPAPGPERLGEIALLLGHCGLDSRVAAATY